MVTGQRLRPSVLLAVGWLAYFTALQWSVVRFEVLIVVTLTVCALGLTVWQVRRQRVELTPRAVAPMLVGSAAATLLVPLFSYLDPTGSAIARALLIVGPVAAAALLWTGRARAAWAALAVSVSAYVSMGALAVLGDPAPRIDVWVMLQQASDALASGVNFYDLTWSGSPGVPDAFTYLPWTAVLLAPGRWLAGDVRWALLGWTLVAALGAWLLANTAAAGHAGRSEAGAHGRGGSHPSAEPNADPVSADIPSRTWLGTAVVALLLFAPGTLTQVDQAWTEPLLLAGLVWWAVLVHRGQAWWAVIPLALACASKQHLALLLPVLMLWRPFGMRRAVTTGALTAVLIAPWFLAGPADFVHDTITLLVSFHAILFANTWYLLALNVFGVELPFWITGLIVLGALTAIALTVRRRQPDLGELLRWLALLLLVANLVNKQAFYNQFWLSGALVVVSLALPVRRPGPLPPTDAQAPDGDVVAPADVGPPS
ncbi:MAG: hypothetical protein WCF36_01715 [Candidatus Nanopelagicales bacterium]